MEIRERYVSLVNGKGSKQSNTGGNRADGGGKERNPLARKYGYKENEVKSVFGSRNQRRTRMGI